MNRLKHPDNLGVQPFVAPATKGCHPKFEDLGFGLFATELLARDAHYQRRVLRGLDEFREHLGGELTVTSLHAIGQDFETHEVDSPSVLESIDELHQRHPATGPAPA